MKFNSNDELLWSTYFGGAGEESVVGLTFTDNDNLIVAGNTNSSVSSSTTASPYCLANNNNQFQLCDQGGSSYFDNSLNNSPSYSVYDIFLACMNTSDQLIWSTYFGGAGNDFLGTNSPLTTTYTATDKYALIGKTNSLTNSFPVLYPSGSYQQGNSTGSGANYDAFVSVFTNEFDRTWCSYFGGSGADFGQSATFDSNDNLYITGTTNSATVTNTCSVPAAGFFPVCNSNGSFYFNSDFNYGYTVNKSDAFLTKFDLNYDLQWSTYIGGTRNETGNSLIVNESSSTNLLCFLGWTESPKAEANFSSSHFPIVTSNGYYSQGYDIYGNSDNQISMFDLNLVVGLEEIHSLKSNFTLYPNPSSFVIEVLFNAPFEIYDKKIAIVMYDLEGRKLLETYLVKENYNQYSCRLNIENLSDGIYFIQASTKSGVFSTKFIKNK